MRVMESGEYRLPAEIDDAISIQAVQVVVEADDAAAQRANAVRERPLGVESADAGVGEDRVDVHVRPRPRAPPDARGDPRPVAHATCDLVKARDGGVPIFNDA